MHEPSPDPRVCVVVIDGLPLALLYEAASELRFLREHTPHWGEAVLCFPSTTGPAYFPLLAHRGLRSYVGPETMFDGDAWPVCSPVQKDSPKHGERSRYLLWAFAHLTERWDVADPRTNSKLGRALGKPRPIVFAVLPSVDEHGHTLGFPTGQPLQAPDRDRPHARADAGRVRGPRPRHRRPRPHGDRGAPRPAPPGRGAGRVDDRLPADRQAEPGGGRVRVGQRDGERLPAGTGWLEGAARARLPPRAGRRPGGLDGIDSVAVRGPEPRSAVLVTPAGEGWVWWDGSGLCQSGPVFGEEFRGLPPGEALARSAGDAHPDAAFALLGLFESHRAGDLLVSASVGYDLRTDREWPAHHASHGALHCDHTVVPYLSSAGRVEGPRRTIDVFSDTLVLAEMALDGYPQSDSHMIAAGGWAPGVAGEDGR